MIGFVKGKVLRVSPTKLVVEAHGVGYLISGLPNFMSKTHPGTEIELWVHTAVRENDISLYGFETEGELCMFELLLTVSGIGPKSAITILGIAGTSALEEAIGTGEVANLTKIAGIGKKTADKIVLELGDKLISKSNSKKTDEDSDVFDALKSLGYRDRDIGAIMREMPKDIIGANDKIKWALKMLSKQ